MEPFLIASGCCIGSFLGCLAAFWLAGRFFVAPGEKTHQNVSRSVQGEPDGTVQKRKPFYGTPEKAAMAEQGRGLPAQWQKRG